MTTEGTRRGPKKSKRIVPGFGAWLLERVNDAGMTRAEFREAIGLSRAYVNKLLADREYPPSEEKLREIASVLDIDPDDVMFRAGVMPEAIERELLALGAHTVRKLIAYAIERDRELAERYGTEATS